MKSFLLRAFCRFVFRGGSVKKPGVYFRPFGGCPGVLFVPSFIKADVYADISYYIAVLCGNIADIRNVRRRGFLFFEFYADPVPCGFVCVVNSFVQCIAGSLAAFQVREKGAVASGFCFAENGGVNKFHFTDIPFLMWSGPPREAYSCV